MLYLPLISRLADEKNGKEEEKNKLSHYHSNFCFNDLSFEFFHHFILNARELKRLKWLVRSSCSTLAHIT